MPNQKQYTLFFVAGVIVIVLSLFVFAFLNKDDFVSTNTVVRPQKVGILQVFSTVDNVYKGFKEGMTELGYVEGRDVVYDYQNWDQDPSKIQGMMKKFIRDDVDLIYAISNPSLETALKETKSAGKDIPIVFIYGEDLLALGLIESYGSSGNNATGVLSNMAEVVPKQLEFLKRINPKAKRLGLFSDGFMYPGGPGELVVAKFRIYAPKFDITLIEYTTKMPLGSKLENAYNEIAATIKPGDLDAVYHVPGHFLHDQQDREIALGKRIKAVTIMPAIEELEESGGTFSYAFDLIVAGRQVAVMADKIFKGTKPSKIPDIPLMQ